MYNCLSNVFISVRYKTTILLYLLYFNKMLHLLNALHVSFQEMISLWKMKTPAVTLAERPVTEPSQYLKQTEAVISLTPNHLRYTQLHFNSQVS